MSIRFVGRFTIKAGEAKRFEELVAAAVAQARTEDGIEEYSFYISGQECIAHEQYRDGAALAAHATGAVGTEILPKALEVADLVGSEMLGDLDDTALGVAEQFGAAVFPGPSHAL